MSQTIIEIIVSTLPVLFFLVMLILFDSFKLVRWRDVILAIVIGSISALVSMFINITLLSEISFDHTFYVRYFAPVVEETAKALFIFFLLYKKKIGFMIDGAIYGFAIGAGFAVVENIYYLHSLESRQIIVWIIRGLGTAVMHGGTTALMTILAKNLLDRSGIHEFILVLPGFFIAIILHSFFNHFFFRPLIMTVGQLILLPTIVGLVFMRSERQLRDWLEVGLDTEVTILEYITSGRISQTKIGTYLQSIMDQFPGEIVADMVCYLQIYLELSICAKGALLMQESGFSVPVGDDVKAKFAELAYLEKSIGHIGKLAIAPLVQRSDRDLWQLYLLS